MGGFAGSHHEAVAKLEQRGDATLVCTCDPEPDRHTGTQQPWRLAARGARVFADYRTMLESMRDQLDLVVVPTPIQLHGEMHAAAAACGLPSYLEKPPTLDPAELERMIAADAPLRHASLVGFNFIIEPVRLALKERLLAGEFGGLRGATFSARLPRPVDYFRRAPWAGRIALDGRLVLDSCLGNALAHQVHNLLFWAGRGSLFSWAQLAAVRAEMYRAHAIEGADTFFVEADTLGGVNMRIAVSHACAGGSAQAETIVCDHATLRYVIGQGAEVRWTDGRVEHLPLPPFDPLLENHVDYFRYLRGETSRPSTTLADSRPFVALNALAYVSSRRIAPVPANRVDAVRDEKEQKDYLSIAGLAGTQEAFLARGVWPGAHGWERDPGEPVTMGDLSRFEETVRALATW